MTTEANKRVVQRFNTEFLELGNTEILDEIVAEDFINHTAASPVPKDVAGLIQTVTMLHKGFSDIKVEIHEQIAEADVVATRKTIHALHTGRSWGVPPRTSRSSSR